MKYKVRKGYTVPKPDSDEVYTEGKELEIADKDYLQYSHMVEPVIVQKEKK
jgi:hypothetical protein